MKKYLPIRILGIDPGFDRLGICILEKDTSSEKLIHSECIVTSKKDSFEKRLSEIGSSIEKILKKYRPSELAIEKIFFTKNQKTAINVAEVRGVCLYLAQTQGLSIFEYSPPEIKLAIVGHGGAGKEDVGLMIPRILKGQLNLVKGKKLDDELDAIAIALAHSASRKMKKLGGR